MTQLSTNDVHLGRKLEAATEPLLLLDASGAVIGRFMPGPERSGLLRPEDGCPVSEEELERRFREETTGRPLAEIWKDLGRT